MTEQQTQQKGPNLALWVIAGIVGLAVLGGVFYFANYMSAASKGNRMENSVKSEWDRAKIIYSTYTQKVKEVAQVPDMYRDDLEKIVRADLEGRYGKDGSQATMQWFKERELNFDSGLYKKIQQVIEAGRNEAGNQQIRMRDVKRVYETALGAPWDGFWLQQAGYPKINLDDYKIVTVASVDEAFLKGREEGPIKLR
jgi:hypothetical protein